MNESQGQVTVDIVRKALHGAALFNNGDLYAQNEGRIPKEFVDAAIIIKENFSDFKNLVWQRLSLWPNTKSYFGPLIRTRLKQKGYLASPLISLVFDDYQEVEYRLTAIKDIPGVVNLKKEYRPSSNPDLGYQTDESARDLLSEILVLHFLTILGFSDVHKQSSASSKPHVDITAEKDNNKYAIDVTRKKEIPEWDALPYSSLEDCNDSANYDKIRNLLIKALVSKNDQFFRVLNSGDIRQEVVKVVAVKTSDYGFAECIDQAQEITENLLAETNNWEHVDAVWLIPNVDAGQSKWIFRK